MWQKNGFPNFGTPVNPNTPLRIPSGEPAHIRLEAEKANLGGTARIVTRPEASHKAKVGYIDTPDSYVEFKATVAKAGNHILAVRFGNGTNDRQMASHHVSVNGKAAGELFYPNSGWDNWSNAFMLVELQNGKNSIRFSKGAGFSEIDCLDVFPSEK